MVVVVVVVVVVRKPTPNYLRQASQNLGKYVLSYTTFFFFRSSPFGPRGPRCHQPRCGACKHESVACTWAEITRAILPARCLELYNLFFSSEVHHLGRAVHAVTNPVVEHVNMNRLLAHGLKLLGRFCQPDVLSYTPFSEVHHAKVGKRCTLPPPPPPTTTTTKRTLPRGSVVSRCGLDSHPRPRCRRFARRSGGRHGESHQRLCCPPA